MSDGLKERFEAIQRLAITASIGSCTCGTKSPDIHWHRGDCRYVLLEYILAQAEDGIEDTRAPDAARAEGWKAAMEAAAGVAKGLVGFDAKRADAKDAGEGYDLACEHIAAALRAMVKP